MKKVKTFSVEYNWFEPGTLVTPASNRCTLERGSVWTVIKCFEPDDFGDVCIVFLEGREWGVNAQYLKDVK